MEIETSIQVEKARPACFDRSQSEGKMFQPIDSII